MNVQPELERFGKLDPSTGKMELHIKLLRIRHWDSQKRHFGIRGKKISAEVTKLPTFKKEGIQVGHFGVEYAATHFNMFHIKRNNYSSGLEVRILKNLGSTDRILKAKISQL